METSNNQRLDEQQRQLDFEGTQLDWQQLQLDFEQRFYQGQQSVWEFRKRQQQIEFKRHLLQGRQILLDLSKRLEEIPRKMKQNDELVKQMQEGGSQIVPTSQDSAPPASTNGGLLTPDVADLDEVQSCQEKDGALFVTTEQIEASEISDRWGEIKLVPMEDHDDSSAPGIKATTADEKRIEVPIVNANLEIQIQVGSERDDAKKPPNSEILEPSKVKSNPFETPPVNYTAENLGDLVVLLVELMEIRLVSAKNVSGNGLRIDSIARLRNLMSAHKVFVKMPTRIGFRADALGLNFSRFKPRIDDEFGIEQGPMANSWPYDRGKGVLIVNTSSLLDCGMEGIGFKLLKSCVESSQVVIDGGIDSELKRSSITLPLDKGKSIYISVVLHGQLKVGLQIEDERSDSISLPYDRGKKLLMLKFKGVQVDLWAMVFVFDPGGSGIPYMCCHKCN